MRCGWTDLPEELRIEIEAKTGPIGSIEPAPAGNHADIAATLHSPSGLTFVKAARKLADRDGPEVMSLRREAAVNPYVSEFAPRLRWQAEAGEWVAIGFEHVTGRRADFTPGSPDLAVLAKTIHALQSTPCPDVVQMTVERRWQAVTEDVSPMAGPALLHTDLNQDNLIISPEGRTYVVDWAFVSRGQAWVELGLLIPWLLKAGHSPREADEWLSQFASWAGAEPSHIDLFSKVFAERWRKHGEASSAPWVGELAALTEKWANHRLGSRGNPRPAGDREAVRRRG
ncbi:phosphotransferase [Actinomadura sp. 7K534]|uniref:phosphotransferase family protein n=1 Tax=Actinomadura sp. 7K534 TaxID=2530366 RepID=UPI001045E007|nr:phosphotransferase [Actinomadura sp. 7K534]TDB97191.1 aminoglycoside phosphotransferase [Actinomadura sp. 7K534]